MEIIDAIVVDERLVHDVLDDVWAQAVKAYRSQYAADPAMLTAVLASLNTAITAVEEHYRAL